MKRETFLDDGPIIACATFAEAPSAISVIRISGFENLTIFKNFFSADQNKIEARRATFCKLIDEEKVFDEIILTYFPGPKSYTGENILELSVHGNPLNVRRIIDLFVTKLNFRHAAAGEFTLRALRNKKLTLSQVEGLDLLLNARSEYGIDHGLKILSGEIHEKYEQLYKMFIKFRISLELLIDFSEDVGNDYAWNSLLSSFEELKCIVRDLAARVRGDAELLLAPTIAIYGESNAGKSSIFNGLLSKNRSIVSSIAGTTRDYVSELLFFKTAHFSLIDTAGVRESDDDLELEGIKRAEDLIEKSFMKILVINPFICTSETERIFCKHPPDLVIFNFADMDGFLGEFERVYKILGRHSAMFGPDCLSLSALSLGTGPIGPALNAFVLAGPIGPNAWESLERQTGPIGPAFLRDFVFSRAEAKLLKLKENDPMLLSRHRQKILSVFNNFNYLGVALTGRDLGIISSEIAIIEREISELIGVIAPDEILTELFSRFCIGK